MTEVTRVPLQPIAKGSLTKLWIGVIVAILLGAGLAWAATPKGLGVETISEGTGASPQMGDVVFVNYVGKLADGTEFDRSQPLPIPPGLFPDGNPLLLQEGAIIDGFITGLTQMKKGGQYVLTIPAEQAYGATPPPGSPIPPNADLTFEVEVVDFMSEADFQARAAAMQQMMQQQQQQQPDGTPPVE
ncbi:FKBP-type peptidyl-prolyl cis-trans isomerase [Qipengyuania sp. XHP0207]|uniref:FKBP-type peptidyl-prolyl cis-trans isomerase n=1 Tax=Qipengyuania sp. XHP0207 TaxID=3038078 RepID=UPI00241FFF2B|nr:FKBP-type peptidyl-prolyl cis-trans isomerase [Qipengyuania sp. XHP0207]MDG5749092.1 FKBP-type peptidyl-prolyl cis-trans isomerase [Qipengyuania sp. XHP0207]